MTDKEINAAIAEACGRTEINTSFKPATGWPARANLTDSGMNMEVTRR